MDDVWVETELATWVKLAEEYDLIKTTSLKSAIVLRNELTDRHMSTLTMVRALLPTQVKQLLYRTYPNDKHLQVRNGILAVRHALGQLRRGRETAEKIGTQAPRMAADKLHPTVWEPASKLWSDHHHGMAVQRAATNLSGHVQDLVGRYDINDSSLMQQVFSSDPPKEGKARLRWPGDPTNLTVKAMNDGIKNFAVGCFQAIRNPVTHTVDDVPKQEALEHLAALSVLARWIDGCETITST
ncbi:TIGR02391 family protein [Rhodococcus sp. MTM3W5.2]|uniref:TIGR02391 family protein n=1 Tax=Rhodococcus sp. MTM3W5.2 TaxID=1805827 RepID=UPI00097C424A|nr:TIGR02391 family protein [Rhodococcus sp. MTM3W5.2]